VRPETTLPVVTVAAASDAAYVPQLGALIASVLMNASRERFIDFVVLDGGVGREGQHLLSSLKRLHPNCRISFVDMTKRFLEIGVHSYFPRSTFYRLALPDLLEDRKKVLFLDTDMVVISDISVLFETDLGAYVAAAAPDLVMRAFCAMGVPPMLEAGGTRAINYLADKLRLGDRATEYFQAGTILFDLEKMRQLKLSKRMQEDLQREVYWFLDQDVLNKHLFDKILFLDNRWNALWMDDYHLGSLSKSDRLLYDRTMEEPHIIHYAGASKPWETFDHPKASYFWSYLRNTPWYENLLLKMLRAQAKLDAAELMQRVIAPTGTEAPSTVALRQLSLKAIIAGKVWRALPIGMRQTFMPLGQSVKRRISP
jgi:lipopolysaccharide biosynthesis glycosyltransferase